MRVFRQLRPELVTLDLSMPVRDGFSCIGEMLALRQDVKILIVSSLADKLRALDAIRDGASGFLLKPVTADKFAVALRALIHAPSNLRLDGDALSWPALASSRRDIGETMRKLWRRSAS